jgi:GT2 family glycosyltransferase
VNNAATDGTEEMLKREYLKKPVFDYVRLSENLGGAGGFHYGIKIAYEKGFDWIWVMDDDALPMENSIEEILKVILNNRRVKVFSSNVIDNAESNYEKEYLKEIKDVRFVGFGLHREVIKKIGLPRKDFFIYFDDQEYAERIKKHLAIYKIGRSIVIHKDWQERESITILGFIKIPKIELWRFYYRGRNQVLRYSYLNFRKYLKLCWLFKDTLLYSFYRKRFLKIGILAIFHGLFNISGKKIKPGLD